MLIAARESFAAAARKRLPYDAEVEYLESTGTQWIDTGKTVAASSRLHFSVQMNADGDNFGSIDSADARCHSDVSAGLFRVGTTTQAYPLVVGRRIDVAIDLPALRYTCDNVTVTMSPPNGLPSSTFVLFGRNLRGTITPCRMRVYAFGLDGVLDYIPVRFTNDQGVSEGALYDRVSGQLFRNMGTGSFTTGLDKTA